MEKTGSFVSRRKLLVGAGGVVAAAAALRETPFGAVMDRTARDVVRRQPALRGTLLSLADAGHGEWLDQVGSTFAVVGGIGMTLVAVTALESSGSRPMGLTRDQSFVAKFDVQNGGTMASDLIYAVSHPQYGAFQIFLQASSDPRLPHRMTALFN